MSKSGILRWDGRLVCLDFSPRYCKGVEDHGGWVVVAHRAGLRSAAGARACACRRWRGRLAGGVWWPVAWRWRRPSPRLAARWWWASTEPTVYDPNRQYSWETYRVDKHIYESLLAEDLSHPAKAGPPPLVPALATARQASPDARTFTFQLRRGVKFHDGTDFNARAVRFNVRRFTDPAFEYYDVRARRRP